MKARKWLEGVGGSGKRWRLVKQLGSHLGAPEPSISGLNRENPVGLGGEGHLVWGQGL